MTIAVSVLLVAAPPYADLGVTGLPAGTTSLRVSRVMGAGTEVIRARGTIAGSTGRVVDYDAPVGRPVAWQVDALSASGGLLESATTAQYTLTAPAEGKAWIMDPMSPRSAMLVDVLVGHDAKRDYVARVAAAERLGMSLPRALTSPRQAPTRSPMWTTETIADYLAMEQLLASGQVLSLRASPTTIKHRTGVLHVACPAVHALEYQPADFVDWSAEGFEAAGVALPPVVVLWTYADLKAMGGTNANLESRYVGRAYLDLARGQ